MVKKWAMHLICLLFVFSTLTMHSFAVNYNFEQNSNVYLSSAIEEYEFIRSAYQVVNIIHDYNSVVEFSESASISEIFEIINGISYKQLSTHNQRIFLMDYNDAIVLQSKYSKLIKNIERESERSVTFSNDPFISQQWAIDSLNIENAWKLSLGTNNHYVCVIDSGIDRTHPDFFGTDIRKGYDYLSSTQVNDDSSGHGTNVTGVIAARRNNGVGIAGVNSNAVIIPFKIVDSSNKASGTNLISAIYDSANLGCNIINISLGGKQYSYFEDQAIQYAIQRGSIVIVSAGNDGDNQYMYPASYDNVISVGSINQQNSPSNFTQYNDRVTIAAPGENIITLSDNSKTYFNYMYVNGTSFSAPYVSAIASLALSIDPTLVHSTFKDYLISSAKDIHNKGYDVFTGYGLADAYGLLSLVSNDQKVLSSILVQEPPLKTSYLSSEALDLEGATLLINYSDNSIRSIPITHTMVSGYNPYTTIYGPQNITVSYEGQTTFFQVSLDRFSDVPYGHRNYNHINALVELGIINGYSDSTFRPNNTLTRAQAAIMILRAIGLSTEGVSSNFSDVPSTHAAYKFISAAQNAGIINGYSDGTFRPNASITRAQIAVILQRAFQIQASGTAVSFSDVPVGYEPRTFIETLASQKIVNGYSDGTFKPTNNVTRAQFSTMIYNTLEYQKNR